MRKKQEPVFEKAGRLPADRYTQVALPGAERDDWYTTSMVSGARNHCGSVAAANAASCILDPGASGGPELLRRSYSLIGNGPIIRVAARTRKLLREYGVRAESQALRRQYQVQVSLMKGYPVILMTGTAPFHLHWVVVVGERIYNSGSTYFCIADGWHSDLRFLACEDSVTPLLAYAISRVPSETGNRADTYWRKK